MIFKGSVRTRNMKKDKGKKKKTVTRCTRLGGTSDQFICLIDGKFTVGKVKSKWKEDKKQRIHDLKVELKNTKKSTHESTYFNPKSTELFLTTEEENGIFQGTLVEMFDPKKGADDLSNITRTYSFRGHLGDMDQFRMLGIPIHEKEKK